MKWHYTDGWDLNDLSVDITSAVDYALKADEKKPFLTCTFSAASKALTLGLDAGEVMIVTNIGGTNAVTVKAISGDTGTSVAAGKCAICIGVAGANNSKIYVLN